MRGAGQIAELAADRRARRRGDHERRPRAPRAAGQRGGDRGGQGRADRRPGAGRDGRGAGRRAAARRPTAATTWRWVTFGPGGDVDELPAGLRLPFDSAHMRRNALAALAAARAIGVEPAGEVEVRLSRLRGQRVRLGSGRGRRERLLQRQPDVDARGPRRPRRVGAGSQGRRAGRHARARPRRGALPRRDRRARPRGRRRRARDRRAAGRAHRRRLRSRRRRARREPTRARPPRSCPGSCDRATRSWSRPRAAWGSRRSPRRSSASTARSAGADGRGPHRGHRRPAHLHLPVAEVHRLPAHARVRAVHPRGGARGPSREGGHADDGRHHHPARLRDPVPDPVELRLGLDRDLRRHRRLRAAGLRRRLHEDRAPPLARACAPGRSSA